MGPQGLALQLGRRPDTKSATEPVREAHGTPAGSGLGETP